MQHLKNKLQRPPTGDEREYWKRRGEWLRKKQQAAEARNIKRRIRKGNTKPTDHTRLKELEAQRP